MEFMSNGELLQAQAHIWNHLFNFINSMSLKCAIQLEIPDIINNHGKPMKLSELIKALPINKAKSYCIYRLMRILVHSGFFLKQKLSKNEKEGNEEEEEEEGYLLAPSSYLLLKNEPLSVRPLYLTFVDPILQDPWQYVSQWFKNDDVTPFDTAHGKTLWAYADHDPKFNAILNNSMASDARLIAVVVVKDCKGVFEGINSLVDVGGGTGSLAAAIAGAFPHLCCSVLDLPHVVDKLEGSMNLRFVGGNMFEAIPHADAILLKSILHDWSDEECLKILTLCKEAIPSKEKGGKVIIIDMVVNDKKEDYKSTESQLFFDMLMMVAVTGRERTEKDWETLFKAAGFSGFKITPVLGLRSLIEVFP